MSNMQHYDNLRVVPREALKPIEFGKLKGKSDINPQWRTESMTKEFGVCGIGWKYEIAKSWTQEANDGQLMLFVEVNLYIKDGEQWSAPIPAIGGDFVLEKDKNGLHGNDEAYKMATTDALGAAMKMLGVAADVYRGLANDSKYGREKPATAPTQQTPAPQPAPQPKQEDNIITDKQLSALVNKAREYGITNEDMKVLIRWKFNAPSSKMLTKKQAGLLIGDLIGIWEEFARSQGEIAATTSNDDSVLAASIKEDK